MNLIASFYESTLFVKRFLSKSKHTKLEQKVQLAETGQKRNQTAKNAKNAKKRGDPAFIVIKTPALKTRRTYLLGIDQPVRFALQSFFWLGVLGALCGSTALPPWSFSSEERKESNRKERQEREEKG